MHTKYIVCQKDHFYSKGLKSLCSGQIVAFGIIRSSQSEICSKVYTLGLPVQLDIWTSSSSLTGKLNPANEQMNDTKFLKPAGH